MSPRSVFFSLFVVVLLLSTEHALAGSSAASLDASSIFLEAPSYGSGGAFAKAVVVADVNADGKPDLILADDCAANGGPCTGAVGVQLGNGDGTFEAAQTYNSGSQHAASVAVADVNGDDKLDVVVSNLCVDANCGNGTLGVLFGNGDGTFQAAQTYNSGGADALSVVVADVNGDGKPDLIAANDCASSTNCNNGAASILFGNGDGTFQAPQSYNSGGAEAISIASADVNGDGKPDLLVANRCVSIIDCSNGAVGVLRGNGDGTFQAPQTYGSGGQNSGFLVVADVNGDGKLDLLVANQSGCGANCGGSIGVLLGNGDSTFQAAQSYSSGGQNANSIAVADVNADGKPDVLVANGCAPGNCANGNATVLLGNGDGTFQLARSYASSGVDSFSIVVADISGDDIPDLLLANDCASSDCTHGSASVLLGNGDGSFRAAPIYSPGGLYTSSIAIGDVNGDGKPDIVAANTCADVNCTNGTIGVLFGNGNGTFQPVQTYNSGGYDALSIAIADVNRDSKPDLVVANQCLTRINCTNGSIAVLLGNGDGTFQPSQAYNSAGGDAVSIAVADVNGDGRPDLVVANECSTGPSCNSNGIVAVLLGNGDGTFQAGQSYSSGGVFSLSVAVADVNADGKPDVLVTNQCMTPGNCQNGGTVAVLLGNGDGTLQPAQVYNAGGQYTNSVAVADLNGDHKLDVLVTNVAGIAVLLGYGDGTFQAALPEAVHGITLSISQIAVADFDGDGKLDAAIGNGSTLLLANGDGTFQNPLYLGAGGNAGAVGDFNIDDKPDLAVGGITILLNVAPRSIATTTTNLGSSPNPSGYGQQVIFTATVTPSGAGTPTGSVTFSDGGNSLGVVALAGGSASLNISTLPAGPHSVVASYTGDSNFNPSTSSAVAQNVNRATTATALSSSPNPSYLKQSVTFTASVSGQFGGAVSGSVTFKQGTTTLATVSLSNGRATYSTTYTSVSTRSITAVYSGDSNDLGSTSPVLNQVVTRVPTSTAVTSSLNPSLIGDAVTFTATVTASNTSLGLPAPTGTVTFKNGGAVLGTSPLNGLTATYTTNSLPAGALLITATYNADSNYIASTSPKLTQTVKRLPTAASLSVNVNPSTYGQSIQFTATIAPASGTGTPTGTVTFKSGTAALATAALNNGIAIYNNSNLAVATKSITAVYNGDSVYASSTSSVVSQVINKAASTMTLTSSLNPSTFGQSVTFTASVTPQYSGTPTGSVTFKRGTTILGTVTLSVGVASYTTSTLPKGADPVNATYNGSVYFIGSTASITENVQ